MLDAGLVIDKRGQRWRITPDDVAGIGEHGDWVDHVLTAKAVNRFRVVLACTSLFAGGLVLDIGPADSLGIALLLLGAFMLLHFLIEHLFQSVRQSYEPPPDSGMRDFASSFVATSGVILGLLAIFASHPFSVTIKVGIGALVVDILVGVILVGLLLAGASPDDQRAWNLIRYLFNVAVGALGFGLFCIGVALIYI